MIFYIEASAAPMKEVNDSVEGVEGSLLVTITTRPRKNFNWTHSQVMECSVHYLVEPRR